MTSIRTPLAKVKGLGSAKDGTHHWWMQRVTAVALIPLSIWFVISLLQSVREGEPLLEMLDSPVMALAMVLWLGVGLYHGRLGMQVVIEDYVHCKCGKPFLLLLLRFATVITMVAGIAAVLVAHVASWVS